LTRETSRQDLGRALDENRVLVSAVFGAVAEFAASGEQKLQAVVQAGKVAEAFLSCIDSGTSRLESGDAQVVRGEEGYQQRACIMAACYREGTEI
jgi:hypothetical protein